MTTLHANPHIVNNVKTNRLTNRRLVTTLPFYFVNKIMMCGLVKGPVIDIIA